MNSDRPRTRLFLVAVLLAWLIPISVTAQRLQAVSQPQESVTITLPAWQKGVYWAKVDQQLLVDFANLSHFHDADAKLGPPAVEEDRVVFMGDSITEGWNLETSFPGKPYINRGISGQTSSQMLLRFRQDVIDLKPKVVLILAGTNDLAGNTGPVTLPQIEGNLMSMAQLAAANGIRVVLCSVLPSVRFSWHPDLENPAPRIAGLNDWIKAYASQNGYVYVDYYSAMKDAAGGLPTQLSTDGVHPLPTGYAIMAPLAESGIEISLRATSGSPSDLATSFQQAVALAEAQEYEHRDLKAYYRKRYAPIFQACFASTEHPDTSPFSFVAAIGKDGRVLRLYLDHETNIFACARQKLQQEEFPRPPLFPYYMHVSMSFPK